MAGTVARDRLARGVRLNYPEAVALLSTWVIERARQGVGVPELMIRGREVLGRDEVLPDVVDMLTEVVQAEPYDENRWAL